MRLTRTICKESDPLNVIKKESLYVTHNEMKRLGDGFLDGPAIYAIKKHKKATIVKNGFIVEYTLT